MKIVKLEVDQIDQVVELFDKYRVFYKQESDIELGRSYLTERLSNKESIVFLGTMEEVEGQVPVGFALLYANFSSLEAKRNWHLGDLYVEEAYRKNGYGEILINIAIEYAKMDKASYISLNTAEDNFNAQRLYESRGFKRAEPNTGFFHYRYDFS